MQLWDRAVDAQKNGRFKEAEDLYRLINSADAHYFDALHMLGIVCYENGKPAEAEQFFLKAHAFGQNVTKPRDNRSLGRDQDLP